jgi:hypothetical protein
MENEIDRCCHHAAVDEMGIHRRIAEANYGLDKLDGEQPAMA